MKTKTIECKRCGFPFEFPESFNVPEVDCYTPSYCCQDNPGNKYKCKQTVKTKENKD